MSFTPQNVATAQVMLISDPDGGLLIILVSKWGRIQVHLARLERLGFHQQLYHWGIEN